MAVTLQVSDVRAEIYRSAGGRQSAGAGAASTALLGRIFHEAFAELVSADARKNYQAAIVESEDGLDEWRAALVTHTYQRLVGPRLRTHHAELNFSPEQVLNLWDAAQELCDWLAELLWKAKERGVALNAALVTAEEPLRWELRDDGWTDAVVLTGVADAVCRAPGSPDWCLIELKTGRTAPEADLAQACLYHQMLSASVSDTNGALALLSFGPRKHEQLFAAETLAEAQERLRHLIGRLAGVLPATEPRPPAPKRDEYLTLGRLLERAFAEYSSEIRTSKPVVGPTFLRFPIELGLKVTINAVQRCVQSVQARLGLEAPPRVSLEGGRLAIDVQRPDREFVYFARIRDQLPPVDKKVGNALTPVGIDLSGRLRLADFAQPENAHLLVAGTTGSGKSEWLRAAVAGLLLTNTPDTLRFAFADPKRNAFQLLRDSPFLYGAIAYEEDETLSLLERLVDEMESRYKRMAEAGADTLRDLIQRDGQGPPRIFFICDEYGFLMAGEAKTRREMERLVKKLGNKARAAGIHMILATQQPSRQVITGPIQTNINARVGLRLPSPIESQMLLGEAGAESLLGKGDLLYKCIGDPVRLQSPYLPEEELRSIFQSAQGMSYVRDSR
ncbi:MAG TPA: FtsK/SpoIIIE domain-containing protein [Blastocatellia bacterium]|nr:FtsK/SpoIIIE domain-containing protein [Blastocatellia bacterium]